MLKADVFQHMWSKQLLKTSRLKEILLTMSNSSFTHNTDFLYFCLDAFNQFHSILYAKISIYTPLANMNFNCQQILQKEHEDIKNIQTMSSVASFCSLWENVHTDRIDFYFLAKLLLLECFQKLSAKGFKPIPTCRHILTQ